MTWQHLCAESSEIAFLIRERLSTAMEELAERFALLNGEEVEL
ncbi:MAG: hypothetical protein O3C40_17235 [Planctomycetota bacterium]|nr:hypothetical protein [Planctomycetota bacterium]